MANHCSNFPRSFIGADIEISDLDVLGASLARKRCFGAVKGKVAPGPMTFFRMVTDDVRGRIAAYVGEGEFTARVSCTRPPFAIWDGMCTGTRRRQSRRVGEGRHAAGDLYKIVLLAEKPRHSETAMETMPVPKSMPSRC